VCSREEEGVEPSGTPNFITVCVQAADLVPWSGGNFMILFLNVLQYLVLALWVGAMFAFAALFAPVLFRELPSRDQAGAVAGDVLARIDSLGLITGGIMVVVTVLQAIDQNWSLIHFGRFLIAVVMLSLVVISAVTVRQKLAAVKQRLGRPLDEVATSDPLRLAYNKYHRIARGLFSLNLLLGTALIVLSAVPQAQ
jgi:uncharacterized membrane protein